MYEQSWRNETILWCKCSNIVTALCGVLLSIQLTVYDTIKNTPDKTGLLGSTRPVTMVTALIKSLNCSKSDAHFHRLEGGAVARVIHLLKQRRSLRRAPCLQRTRQTADTGRGRLCVVMYLYINLSNYATRSAIYRRRALDNQRT